LAQAKAAFSDQLAMFDGGKWVTTIDACPFPVVSPVKTEQAW
jgi:hypothetical protein